MDSELEIQDYSIIRKDRKNKLKSIGGGIMIYYKSELSLVDVTEEYNDNIEHIWAKIHMSNCKQISLGLFYRPPDSTEEQVQFLSEIMSKNKSKSTILIGDFNYGDINWKNNTAGSVGKKFLKVCTQLNLKQCVKTKTRGNNILDLVLVNDKNFIYKLSQMAPLARSDHNILNVVLNVRVKYKNTYVKCYSYNKANYNILEDKLNEVNWEEEVNNNNVNEVWEKIKNIMISFRENSIKQFKKSTTNDVPWLNAKLKKLIRKRNNLFKRFKKTNQSYSKMKYVIARNDVTKRIRIEKKKYELSIIKRSKNNKKVFYKYVANLNSKNSFKKVGPLCDQGGRIVAEDKEVASLLNAYFVSVFTKDCKAGKDFEKKDVILADSGLCEIKISETDVINAIGDFKEHKAPGVDGITSTYALKTKGLLARPLKLLYDKSLHNNEIPKDWKMANISPIFKKGDKSEVENYRPVSLTVFYGKVLEKIIKKNIESFLIKTNFVKNSQHGFMKGGSCLSNLLICQDSIASIMDDGVPVDVIYLDFQKAFDKVPYDRLVKKLEKQG